MAYLDANGVKAIRKELKAKFPNLKFSVRKSSGSLGVDVAIVAGDIDFSDIDQFDGHAQINHYHIERFYPNHAETLKKISEIAHNAPGRAGNKKYYDNSDPMTDYFDTSFYVHIEVGKWNRAYVYNDSKKEKKVYKNSFKLSEFGTENVFAA